MYSTPVLLDGDDNDEQLRSKLILFEDGHPLRRAHEQHSTITGTGRGAYSHWGRHIFFASSDNSNPNTNLRSYSYAIDHIGQHESIDDDTVTLHSPFYLQDGSCWGVAVPDEGDSNEDALASTMLLFEDGRLLAPSHASHADIAESGSGRYSHWGRYLYFSTTDGSDPNVNGRLYTYEISR